MAGADLTAEPSLPVTPATDSWSVTGSSETLVYGTSTVVTWALVCGQAKVPPCTGVVVTGCSTAAMTSRRPAPWARTSPGTSDFADETRAALSCCPVQVGCACLTMAAAPATCGVAIDVPDMAAYALSPRPPARAAEMPTPGAEISGLRCVVDRCGPAAGEPRGHVLAVHRADGQHGGSTAGSRDRVVRRALVARGDDEEARAGALRAPARRTTSGRRRRRAPRCCPGSWR